MYKIISKYLIILTLCIISFSCENQTVNLNEHQIMQTCPFEFAIQLNCKIVEGESSSSCCTDIRPVYFLVSREQGKIIIKPKNNEELDYIKKLEIIKVIQKY